MSRVAAADLIVINGDIRTMDPLTPRVRALAVARGRIRALGADSDIRALADRGTRVVDAGGRLVLPGFQDTHLHVQDSGTGLALSCNLEGARTVEDMQAKLKSWARAHPDRRWVQGVGWYSGIFGAHNLNRHVLDEAIPDRPVYLYASDGHNAAMNTLGMAEIGLDADIADPPNGHIVRDAQGGPTGLLYEDAVFWARKRLPPRADTDYAAGVRYAQALCNAHGITGVLDAKVEERHMRVYRTLDSAGELTVRVASTALVTPDDTVPGAVARLEGFRRDARSPMLSMNSAKFFLDGVLENRTGAMLADYSDSRGGNAPLMFDEAHLRALFIAFDAARFQIHVHVIGDRAARVALDCIEAARAANGVWPGLHQLAHLQCIDPADIVRFRDLGVVANIQPFWARHEPSVTDIALPMIGADRGRWMYAFRSLLDAGAPYTVSSDWGVTTLNPFAIMQTAVTRQPIGKGRDHPVFLPEQRLTAEQVVRGYTVNAAAAAWRSDETGTLAPGRHADLILLDRDIFAIDPHEIADTAVQLTLLGGREVYRAPGFSG